MKAYQFFLLLSAIYLAPTMSDKFRLQIGTWCVVIASIVASIEPWSDAFAHYLIRILQ